MVELDDRFATVRGVEGSGEDKEPNESVWMCNVWDELRATCTTVQYV